MAVHVRPGDLDADRKIAVETFVRYLNPRYDEARFEWMYRANPCGTGRLWLATDASTGVVVGTAGAFPRRLRVEDRGVSAWVLGDFCVAEGYRSVGPALALQRACLEAVRTSGDYAWYDFPSPSMLAVHRRLGVQPCGRMVRLSRPLRIDHRMFGSLPVAIAGRLGRMADAVLDIGLRHRAGSGCEVSIHQGPAGPEFSALAQQVSAVHALCLDRSSEYVSWRYLANPVARHELLTARRDGVLLGYAVICQEERSASLVDLFGLDERHVLGDLVRAAAARVRQRGAVTFSAYLWSAHPWRHLFRRLGFRPREASPVIVSSAAPGRLTHDLRPWLLTNGDRDS